MSEREISEGEVRLAFKHQPLLLSQILEAINQTPQHTRLFGDIARYHRAYQSQTGQQTQPSTHGNGDAAGEEPASKKRRLENGVLPIKLASSGAEYRTIFEAKDISFSIPLRKKLPLELAVDASNRARPNYVIRARNPTSQEIEFQAELSSFRHIYRLPVPEKAQKQYNFCLIPSSGEPLLFTVHHGRLKAVTVNDPDLKEACDESENVLETALDFVLRGSDQKVMYPSEDEFVSATPEAHRKDEKAYHVKAFRGNKDGYLFFLPTGILFAFKKPLTFFPLDTIESISYTSILQHTFNLNISHGHDEGHVTTDVEFSMLDQADFAGIDAYIKQHHLQDASMAEVRRAKKLGVKNEVADAAATSAAAAAAIQAVGNEDADERSELDKAAAQAALAEEEVDEEDELEEDYDPGSEGESEGSGEDSDEEDGAAEGNEELVEEDELGSEIDAEAEAEAEAEGEDAAMEPDPDDEDQL